ncbi:MAG: hypothetical protein COA84_04670 [Robiginitomaculum sp.]|nr:MAG: hypothetical protein COA84_04670 [Robiginitomaculum sp.]
MRRLNLALALWLLISAPAFANIRDASLGIEGSDALSLIQFDRQPADVTVRAAPQGLDIFVSGVSARATTITPPDTHLISAIDVTPVQGGVQLTYHFTSPPLSSRAEIYANAIMIRAGFDHPLGAQRAGLHFKPAPSTSSTPVRTTAISAQQQASTTYVAPSATASTFGHAQSPDQKSNQGKTQTAQAEPAPSEYTQNGRGLTTEKAAQGPKETSEHKVPKHDGDVTEPPEPDVRGTGMIRDAAVTQSSESLSAQTCAAVEKAVQDDPWALDKLSLYGACIAKEGRTGEAKEVFERLLTFDPDMMSAYMGLGAIAQESGNTAEAKRHYQQALKLGGSDAQATQIRSLLGALNKTPQH